jgi:hypothetical protein
MAIQGVYQLAAVRNPEQYFPVKAAADQQPTVNREQQVSDLTGLPVANNNVSPARDVQQMDCAVESAAGDLVTVRP